MCNSVETRNVLLTSDFAKKEPKVLVLVIWMAEYQRRQCSVETENWSRKQRKEKSETKLILISCSQSFICIKTIFLHVGSQQCMPQLSELINVVCCSSLDPLLDPEFESRDGKAASRRRSMRSRWSCAVWCLRTGHSRSRSTLSSHCCYVCVTSSMDRSMLSLNRCCSEISSRHYQVCSVSTEQKCKLRLFY